MSAAIAAELQVFEWMAWTTDDLTAKFDLASSIVHGSQAVPFTTEAEQTLVRQARQDFKEYDEKVAIPTRWACDVPWTLDPTELRSKGCTCTGIGNWRDMPMYPCPAFLELCLNACAGVGDQWSHVPLIMLAVSPTYAQLWQQSKQKFDEVSRKRAGLLQGLNDLLAKHADPQDLKREHEARMLVLADKHRQGL